MSDRVQWQPIVLYRFPRAGEPPQRILVTPVGVYPVLNDATRYLKKPPEKP